MNQQNSFKHVLVVAFLILMLFVGAAGIYKKNHFIMNPDPYLPHLTSGSDVEPLNLLNAHVAQENIKVESAGNADVRLGHRMNPITKEDGGTKKDVLISLDKKNGNFIFDREQLITATEKGISAYSAIGEPLFSFELQEGRKVSKGGLVATESLIIFSTEDGHLYGIDRSKGEPEWITTRTEPMYSGPVLFAQEDSPQIIQVTDGKKAQTIQLLLFSVADGKFVKTIGPLEAGIAGRPTATADGYFYYTTTNGHLHAINLNEGKLAWTNESAAGYQSAAKVSSAHVYTVSEDGMVYAFERLKGKKVWESALETTVSSPIFVIESIGIGSLIDSNGYLFAFDIRNGKKLWRYNTNFKGGEDTLTGAKMDPTTFKVVSFQSEVRGWSFWAACTDGRLCLFDPKSGVLLHRLEMKGNLAGAPLWSNLGDHIWIPTTPSKSSADIVLRGYEFFKPSTQSPET